MTPRRRRDTQMLRSGLVASELFWAWIVLPWIKAASLPRFSYSVWQSNREGITGTPLNAAIVAVADAARKTVDYRFSIQPQQPHSRVIGSWRGLPVRGRPSVSPGRVVATEKNLGRGLRVAATVCPSSAGARSLSIRNPPSD